MPALPAPVALGYRLLSQGTSDKRATIPTLSTELGEDRDRIVDAAYEIILQLVDKGLLAAPPRREGLIPTLVTSPDVVAGKYGTLTAMERRVLASILAGRTNKAAAKELSISHRTVEVHRGRIMAKLGARTAVQLAQLAAAHGFVVK